LRAVFAPHFAAIAPFRAAVAPVVAAVAPPVVAVPPLVNGLAPFLAGRTDGVCLLHVTATRAASCCWAVAIRVGRLLKQVSGRPSGIALD
jgi:hypothetical protein